MNRLTKIGFQNAGHWVLNGSQLELELTYLMDARNVLYAFVSGGEVKYIGKTTQTLDKRLYGYKCPGRTQSTNIKNNTNIKTLLATGKTVEIMVLADNGLLSYGGYRISLAAGLEDSLISFFLPPWNGPESESGSEVSPEIDDCKKLPTESTSKGNKQTVHQNSIVDCEAIKFEFQLRPTYFDQGFFNIRVEFMHAFADNGTPIKIFLGKRRTVVDGRINRSVNSNNTPRIMGGAKLRDWFHRKYKMNGWVSVEILSPKSIWIH